MDTSLFHTVRRTAPGHPLRGCLALLALVGGLLPAADYSLDVDFGVRTDPPLVKKLSLFNSGLVHREQYERDVGSFGELKPESWRMDLSIGKDDCPMWADLVGGSAVSGLTYDWAQADWLKARFDQQDILPCWGLSYIPHPLQLRAGDGWMYVDNANGGFRWDRWRQVGRDFAQHFRAGGRTGYYEVYNEGDLCLDAPAGGSPLRLPVERDGSNNVVWDDARRQHVMDRMHIEMAKGIREGDPDAVVGGPSYSGHHLWYAGGFCDAVIAAGAPLDFLSYHAIAIDDTLGNGISRSEEMRTALRNHPQLRTTEMHLNEYFAYSPSYITEARTASADLAMRLVDDLDHFLAQTDVCQLTWAFGMDPQFPGHPMDSFIGLVDTAAAGPLANRRKVFSAFACYGDLPVQRVASGRPGPIRTLAGIAADKAAVIIWNTDSATHHVALNALAIPFTSATRSTYVIDSDDDPKGLVFAKARSEVAIAGTQTWSGDLEGRSVTYLAWTTAPVAQPAPASQLVRVQRDFPVRGTTRFADFDRRTWTGYVGTGADPGTGGNLQQVGVTVRGLAPALRLVIDADGPLPGGAGALGLRADYEVGSAYAKSVFFHAGAAAKVDCPWGTGQPYQQEVTLPELWRTTINLAAFAPANWTGKAVLTMVLANAAPNVRVRFTLRPGDLASGGVVGGPGTPPSPGQPTGTGSGLLASYAAGQDFDHPALTRIDRQVDFDWNASPPDALLGHDNYCARWTGFLEAPANGSYTIIARSDDGVRLWLDGQPVIDDWVGRGVSDSAVTRTLAAGRHALRMDYFQGIGGAEAHLQWIGPGIPRQAIPTYRLYPASGPAVTPVGGGLVAWYRFASPGGMGLDSSGQANHALSASQVARPGSDAVHPSAAAFTGASRFTIPCTTRGDFSIACWVKAADDGRPGTTWWQGAGLVDGDQPWATSDLGVSLLGGKVAFGVGDVDKTITSSSAIPGAWHHVAVTRRNGDGRMEVFVDGQRQASANGPVGARAVPESLAVGRIASGGGYFTGSLDDLRIYDRVLADGEVAALAVPPAPVDPGGGNGNGGGGSGGGGGKCGNGVWVGLLLLGALWWRRRAWGE